MIQVESYKDFKHGVVNAIEVSDLPKEAMFRSQNMLYSENRWRKLPGLHELNQTQLSADPVLAIGKWHSIIPEKAKVLASCGSDLFAEKDDGTFESVDSVIVAGSLLEFLAVPPFTYYGSQKTKWRRFDGGTTTYPVGGENGDAADAPRKFVKIVFNPYAGRYFAIGDPENPDYLNWSAHIDNEGIEKWPSSNVQIFDSVNGDSPQTIDIYEGRITVFSQHSINSGSVVGVPQNWSFQKERAQAGCIAGRTVQRYGASFFMLTPEFEVYRWPADVFVSKGRVKLNINPNKAHLAVATIRDDRYYELVFESGEAVSSNKYHQWTYDILGDRWYGPHIQRNLVSFFKDEQSRRVLCGGIDDLEGHIYEMRGLDIKNTAMKCRLTSGFQFQGDMRFDKRYEKFRVRTNQAGSLPNSEGQLEVLINTDQNAGNQQAQRLVLQDPENKNLADTSHVKDSIIKRANIYDKYGKGSSIQFDFLHEVLGGEFTLSEYEVEFRARTRKANRGV